MLVKNCLVCGKEFKTYPSKVKTGRGKYCSRKCSDSQTLIKPGQQISTKTQFQKNQTPHNKKGWRYHKARKDGKKYKEIYKPEHPNATKAGYVREHRLIVEKKIGRYLKKNEIVHHINGDTLDNRASNLELMSKAEHDRMNTPLNIHRRWHQREVV